MRRQSSPAARAATQPSPARSLTAGCLVGHSESAREISLPQSLLARRSAATRRGQQRTEQHDRRVAGFGRDPGVGAAATVGCGSRVRSRCGYMRSHGRQPRNLHTAIRVPVHLRRQSHEVLAQELEGAASLKLQVFGPLLDANKWKRARDQERAAAVDLIAAERIRRCGTSKWASQNKTARFTWRYCNRRNCPGCSARHARKNAQRIVAAIRRMPLVTLVTYPVRWRPGRDPSAAKAMVGSFRHAFAKLRRRNVFEPIGGGVGAIEAKLSNDLSGFDLHAHLVLDATRSALMCRESTKFGLRSRSVDTSRSIHDAPNLETTMRFELHREGRRLVPRSWRC